MTDKKPPTDLVQEVQDWESGQIDPRDWIDAPERIPRVGESESISLRMPKKLLAILREFARREGVGYQVLIKQWLDDRVRAEYEKMKGRQEPREDAIGQLQREFRVLEGRLSEIERDLRKRS